MQDTFKNHTPLKTTIAALGLSALCWLMAGCHSVSDTVAKSELSGFGAPKSSMNKRYVTPFAPSSHYALKQVVGARRQISQEAIKASRASGKVAALTPTQLEIVLKEAINSEKVVLTREVWDQALRHFLAMEPQLKVNDPSSVLDRLQASAEKDDFKPQDTREALRLKLLESLRKVSAAEDKDILANRDEAVYIAANRLISESQSVNTGIDNLSLDISPQDIANAYEFFCDPKLCQASMIKPLQVNYSFPIGLNANITVVFSRAYDVKHDDVLFTAHVAGSCHPIKLGNLLAMDVTAGFNLEYYPKSKKMEVKNVSCGVGLSCNTPILNLRARLTNKGISFGSSIEIPEQIPSWLVKMAPTTGEFDKSIPFDKVDDEILKLYRQAKGLPAQSGQEVDVTWEDLIREITSRPPDDVH